MSETGAPAPTRWLSAPMIAMWCAIWAAMLAGAAWLTRTIDWPAVAVALQSADLIWVFMAFVASLCGLPIWVVAWRRILGRERAPSLIALFEAQSVTLAAIQTFSILGGGATALFLLVRRVGLGAAAATSLLALDQLLTGIVKALIIGAAIALTPAPAIMRATALTLTGAAALALLGLAFIGRAAGAIRRRAGVSSGRSAGVVRLMADIAASLSAARSPSALGVALVLYVARRSMEWVAALCVQVACGLPPSPDAALLVVAALSIATILPGPPGNVGVFEAAVTLAYVAFGVAPELAIALAVLQHVAFLAAMTLPGYVVLVARRPWRGRAAMH